MDWPIFMIKTVEQIKEEVDITYAQIERRPEKRKKREKKFLHFLKIPLKKRTLYLLFSSSSIDNNSSCGSSCW